MIPLHYRLTFFARRPRRARRLAVRRQLLADDRPDLSGRALLAALHRLDGAILHDVVGHGLSVIVLQLVAALSLLEDAQQDDPLRARLLSVERSARDALAEMRRLLDLVEDGASASLSPQPGLAQLEHLVDDTRAAGAEIELAIHGEPAELPAGIDLAAFRILQESLTNVLKHARPPRAAVSVNYSAEMVIVEVIDQGANPAKVNAGGRGLAGMRERVALYGGDLDLGARPEGGFLVRARLPLRQ
jgi:signal transduction histidine kinase